MATPGGLHRRAVAQSGRPEAGGGGVRGITATFRNSPRESLDCERPGAPRRRGWAAGAAPGRRRPFHPASFVSPPPQVGGAGAPRGGGRPAVVPPADAREGAGAEGGNPAEGRGVRGVPPADLLAGP